MCKGGLVQLLMMLAKPRTKLIRTNSLDSFTLIKIIVLLHNESVYVIIIACNIFISTYLKKIFLGDVVGAKFAHA